MNDLQKIWNDIPESPISETEVEEVANRKSVTEIGRIKRVLKFEVYITFTLLVLLWFARDLLGVEMFFLFCAVTIIGGSLNLSTLWRLKRLELFQDLRHFLKGSIKVLRSFVTAFMLTVQVVGFIVALFVKSWKAAQQGWGEWLSSPDGLLLIFLLIMINAVLISYIWMFYIRRIKSLTSLLEEIDDGR